MTAASASVVEQLRSRLLHTQQTTRSSEIVPTGLTSLDQMLPANGLPVSCVMEWVSSAPGLRTMSVALRCVSVLLQRPGVLAVVDERHEFHAAAASALGVPLSRLLLVRPPRSATGGAESAERDSLWSLEQLARSSGVRVVVCATDRLTSVAMRRLQLAVEHSGATVVLIRNSSALRQTSWADFRFHVQSETVPPMKSAREAVLSDEAASSDVCETRNLLRSSRLVVSLLRSRNAVRPAGSAVLELDHETGVVSEIPELAGAATSASPNPA